MPLTKSNLTLKPADNMPPQPSRQWQFEAIGTVWWLGIYQTVDATDWSALQKQILARIDSFDRTYSRFRDDSLVTAMSREAGSYDLPNDATVLLDWYRQLYDVTDGRVTPLIGQALSDAGYDAHYGFETKTMSAVPSWDAVMAYKAPILKTTQPVLLDVGAAGKGYLVDIIAELLQEAGIIKYCVDAGGDMVVRNVEPTLRIGLENPHDSSQVIGIATISEGALCGSAGNRRRWGEFNHMLDPQTLRSPQHIAAVWVMAATALEADGLTTALYFSDLATLQTAFAFEYALLFADGTLERSAGFEAEVFGETDV